MTVGFDQPKQTLDQVFSCGFLVISGSFFYFWREFDYGQFVSGSTQGPAVTISLLAASGAVYGIRAKTLNPVIRASLVIAGTAPSVILGLTSGVRLLVLPALAPIIVWLFDAATSRRPVALLFVVLPLIALSLYELLATAVSSRALSYATILDFDRLVGVGYFESARFGMGPNTSLSSPLIRLFSGLISYPASALGGESLRVVEPAHWLAAEVRGHWVSHSDHMPGTIFMDLYVSQGWIGLSTALGIGTLLGGVQFIENRAETVRVFFLPALSVFSVLLARGSVLHSTSSISAAVVFSLVLLILFKASLYFFRQARLG